MIGRLKADIAEMKALLPSVSAAARVLLLDAIEDAVHRLARAYAVENHRARRQLRRARPVAAPIIRRAPRARSRRAARRPARAASSSSDPSPHQSFGRRRRVGFSGVSQGSSELL